MRRYLPAIIILSVLGICVVVVLAFNSQQKAEPTPVSSIAPGATPAHVRGSASAPIVIEEFGDFQCPPCGALYPGLKEIESEYGSKVAVVFRENPIPEIHNHALEASHAAEAAGLQGKFWEMHDRLYENQVTWASAPSARPFFVEYARELGLDTNKFQSDMDNPSIGIRSLADKKRGLSMGVGGTPTVFVNGRMVKPIGAVRAINASDVRLALESVMKDKGL